MKHVCRFCKTGFDALVQEDHVCIDCREEVKTTISSDTKLKFELLEMILKDEVCIERIAKAMFEVPVRNLGIGGDGTISEFFRNRKQASSTRRP